MGRDRDGTGGRDVYTVLWLDWYAHEFIDRLLSAEPEGLLCGCGCDQAVAEARDRLRRAFRIEEEPRLCECGRRECLEGEGHCLFCEWEVYGPEREYLDGPA